jgi:hypothetical protein
MADETTMLTIPEAARQLGLDEGAVRLRIARRKLAARRRDGEWLVLLPRHAPAAGPAAAAHNGTAGAPMTACAPERASPPATPPAGQPAIPPAAPDPATALTAELAALRGQLEATVPVVEQVGRLIAGAQERLAAARDGATAAGGQMAPPARVLTREALLRRAFVLDEAALARLDRVLAGLDAPRRYLIATGDGLRAEADSLAALLSAPPAAALPITGLTASTAGSGPTRAVISLRGAGRSGTIAYDVTGDAAEVLHLAGQLEAWVDGITPWYARLAVTDLTGVIVGLGLLAWLTAVVVTNRGAAGGLLPFPEALLAPFSAPAGAAGLALALLAALGLLAVSALLDRLKRWLLPVATFAIGPGRRRHQRLVAVRTQVLGLGIALPILAVLAFCWLGGAG